MRFIGLLIGTMIILFNCSVYFVNSKDTDVTWNGYSFTIWNKNAGTWVTILIGNIQEASITVMLLMLLIYGIVR